MAAGENGQWSWLPHQPAGQSEKLVQTKPEKFAITDIREAAESRVYNRVFDYQVSKGLGPREVSALYEKNIKQLESIGFTPRFGAYREHLLAYAASRDIL